MCIRDRVDTTRCAMDIVPKFSMGLNSPIRELIPAAVINAAHVIDLTARTEHRIVFEF